MAALDGQRTFLQLQNAVGLILFNQTTPSTTTSPTLAQIKEKINEYYRNIMQKMPWAWDYSQTTLSTVAGTNIYALPDTVFKPWALQIQGNNWYIQYVPNNKLFRGYPGAWQTMGNNQPYLWTYGPPASNNALQIELFPTPDAVYTVYYQYQKRLTSLSADGDYGVIPPEYENAIVYGAAKDLLALLADNRAPYYAEEYKKIISDMWMNEEKNLDYMDSAMSPEVNGTQWPGVIRPYVG